MTSPVCRWLGIAVGAALLASISHAADKQIDIRDCPLDTMVFLDPWAEQVFKVKRVGTDYSFSCEDETKPPDDSCRGPYGDLVLEGEWSDWKGPPGETMYATYRVIDGVPCCDWHVTKQQETKFGPGFKWLEPKDVPLLKTQPFLSIESGYDTDFGNPLYVVSCTLRQ